MQESGSSSQLPFEQGRALGVPLPEDRFWAKLSRDRTGYHPLIAHSADVAAVVTRLLQPGSLVGNRLARAQGVERLSESTRARLTYLAAIHDVGKANHGFQNQRHANASRSPGHVRVLLESLCFRPLAAVWRELLTPVHPDAYHADELLRTAVCHHGRPWNVQANTPNENLWRCGTLSTRDPLAEIQRLAELARAWSGVGEVAPDEPLAVPPRFLHLFAGVLTLADWVGSTRVAFPFAPDSDSVPHRYWDTALERADAACVTIGLTPRSSVVALQGSQLLERIFPSVFATSTAPGVEPHVPTPLQRRVAEMALPAHGSRVLVESETGSGKTEAALALYARLRAEGMVGGLVFALPTRSTATAMHKRITAALEGMYEPQQRPTVALAMGGEQPDVEATGGSAASRQIIADQPLTYPDQLELVNWSSDGTKKFFAAEIVVGTIDQILLGGLTVKHAHLRLASLSRHLIIVDELHSYDVYMTQVLKSLLDFHSAAGGISLLMSATLSDRERQRFGPLRTSAESQGCFDEAIQRPYPVVSVCACPGLGWHDEELEPNPGQPKPRLDWRLCSEGTGLQEAIACARTGARVCIMRNTVKSARATIEAIVAEGAADLLWRLPGSDLTPAYHSRYTLQDRMTLDTGVLESYGSGATRGSGRILVATQVAEQSLDVDFDHLVTDLCPVDVLLQRLGRVWRHRERDAIRPRACAEAQIWVIQPDAGFDSLLNQNGRGPCGWGTVYQHLGVLELTRRTIESHPTVAVPQNNRMLVESVYHAECQEVLRGESERWEAHFESNDGRSISQTIGAANALLRFGETYIENAPYFDASGERAVRTRLGADYVRVLLPSPLRGYYSTDTTTTVDLPYDAVSRAGLPAEQLERPVATLHTHTDEAARYSLGSLEFFYGPNGWEW